MAAITQGAPAHKLGQSDMNETSLCEPHSLTSAAIGAFENLLAATLGFRPREGQTAMAHHIAHTLANADLGDCESPQKAIAVVQAGTGVGKSAAYLSTVVAMALERKTRVLVSTATVALQEQLMQKDLPALAETLSAGPDQPLCFALAKGRGRYICKLKLEQQIAGGAIEDDFFEAPLYSSNIGAQASAEQRAALYAQLQLQLASQHWDGDRDALSNPVDPADWSAVAAERHTCTARHCPRYRDCSYYQARSRLAEAHVIVANHDLVLASLGMKTLPELDNCLVVFDEGHHLPAVALDQFSSSMDLSHLRWLDRLPKAMQDVRNKLQQDTDEALPTVCSQLKVALNQCGAMVLDLVQDHNAGNPENGSAARSFGAADIASSMRFEHGKMPDALQAPMTQILSQATGLAKALEALGNEVKTLARDEPMMAPQCAQWYASLGGFAPRIDSLARTAELLLEEGEQPLAKWLTVEARGGFLQIEAHACPIIAADLLRQFVWSRVRAAVITSASLTSCGSFDYFLRESGLINLDHVHALQVQSPFNYAEQGTLTVVHTRSDPKNADAYTAEMIRALLQDLQEVTHGALALFTSRSQMRAALDLLNSQDGKLDDSPDNKLAQRVLVQGSQSRSRLLAAHTARIESGLPSILFGLQSFGEGLDLPGLLCETVFIAKLPFAPPSAPVDAARAEWLRKLGRDPFSELVIPATSVKLLQWTGRAIRTENDQAHVICYDKRLQLQSYGRRLLDGLPPYRVLQRKL